MWTTGEKRLLAKLDSPRKIQDYLDSLPYDVEEETRCARSVIKEKKADCFSGALFAAAALQNIGFAPMLVELCAVNDDGHVLAVFRKNGCFGAVAKSNFTTLRYREPVYRTARELVMSYFDLYFNTIGQKTLRGFSGPVEMNGDIWTASRKSIERAIDGAPHHRILERKTRLSRADPLLLKAGLLGSNKKGLFIPKRS